MSDLRADGPMWSVACIIYMYGDLRKEAISEIETGESLPRCDDACGDTAVLGAIESRGTTVGPTCAG